MNSMPDPIKPDGLHVHRAVMQAVGPEGLAELVGRVTDKEAALITLILQALNPDGTIADPAAYAVLADPELRDAYLAEAAR